MNISFSGLNDDSDSAVAWLVHAAVAASPLSGERVSGFFLLDDFFASVDDFDILIKLTPLITKKQPEKLPIYAFYFDLEPVKFFMIERRWRKFYFVPEALQLSNG